MLKLLKQFAYVADELGTRIVMIIRDFCAENEDASCEILGMVNAIISLNQQ